MLEVQKPHTFLIAERPPYYQNGKPRLLLVHNGIPALSVGFSLAFGSTPTSLSLAKASISISGMSVTFGPVGIALGVVTSLGFLGYEFFKKQDRKKTSFYIEHSSDSSDNYYPQDLQTSSQKYVSKNELVKNNFSLINASVMSKPESSTLILILCVCILANKPLIFCIIKPLYTKPSSIFIIDRTQNWSYWKIVYNTHKPLNLLLP